MKSNGLLGILTITLALTNLTLTNPVQLWVDTGVDASSPFNANYFYRVLPGQ